MKTKISEIEYHFDHHNRKCVIVIHRNTHEKIYHMTFKRIVALGNLHRSQSGYSFEVNYDETLDDTYCAIDVF